VSVCEITKVANKARIDRRKFRKRQKAKSKREEAREPEKWYPTLPAM
jgi:hypothetical protein